MIELSGQIGRAEPESVNGRDTTASPDDAFAALVSRQSGLVFRVAHSVLRNTHDAEDVTQEAFLKLYRSGAWKEMRDERAFLARTVWRLAVERRSRLRAATTNEEADIASGAQTPEQSALSTNWSAVVHRLIDALPSDLREPLVLAAMEDLNSGQIGEILGLPDGTVRSRLLRARQLLKAKLAAILETPYGKR